MPLLGQTAPDFVADSTQGPIHFHKWIEGSWCLFFSHPKNFTPVCTTEIAQTAKLSRLFEKRGVKLIGLSVDTVESHKRWIKDIETVQNVTVTFPLIADPTLEVAELYQMVHEDELATTTVRGVFIIDPAKKIRLALYYPAVVGRNLNEILRVVDALQLSDRYSVATPANWSHGEDCFIADTLQDQKEIEKLFPKGFRGERPYLRYVSDPSISRE